MGKDILQLPDMERLHHRHAQSSARVIIYARCDLQQISFDKHFEIASLGLFYRSRMPFSEAYGPLCASTLTFCLNVTGQ